MKKKHTITSDIKMTCSKLDMKKRKLRLKEHKEFLESVEGRIYDFSSYRKIRVPKLKASKRKWREFYATYPSLEGANILIKEGTYNGFEKRQRIKLKKL